MKIHHATKRQIAPGIWGHARPLRDTSWWHRLKRERACRKTTGHCWHPDGLIDWWCCMCGADTEGSPPQNCVHCVQMKRLTEAVKDHTKIQSAPETTPSGPQTAEQPPAGPPRCADSPQTPTGRSSAGSVPDNAREKAEAMVQDVTQIGDDGGEGIRTYLVPGDARENVSTCPRCGSPRWVAVSLDEGYTRRRQCVPCGRIHPGVIGPGWKAEAGA
jgi:hypothetical protein